MTVVAANDDDSQAVSRINGALRGPATEALQQLIPELRAHTRRDAYERIMNNPTMAARCFREFRARPELFRDLMVGPDARPVSSDDQPLSCGKTLAQVITLIVRAVAKRYFRARLGFIRRAATPQKKRPPGLFAIIFGAFRPPPPPPPVRKEYTRADALYRAMRDHLLFEWQVSLIPHYATLPVSLVNTLGARILDYREVAQIEALARSNQAPGSEPAAAAPNAVPSSAAPYSLAPPPFAPSSFIEETPAAAIPQHSGARVAPASGTVLAKIDVLRSICRRFGLASLFGLNETGMHNLIEAVNGPGRPILTSLTRAGLAPPKTVVMAACIARRVGLTRFETLMSSGPAATFLRDLARQVRERDLNALESAGEILQATNTILDQLLRNYAKARG